MAALTGLFIADSYKALLKTVDNDVLGAAAKEIVDGYGNVSGVLFDTSGNVTINGNFRALDAILDSSGSAGTAGQVLTTTGSTTQWQSLSSVSGVTGSGTAGYLPLWSTNSALINSIALQSGSTITINGTLTATTKINTPTLQLTGGTGAQGTLSWNADEETVDLIQNGATLQLGQEVQIHCKNQTGALIPDGTPVYAAGTLGASGRIKIAPMIANGSIDAKYFLGVTTEDIADGEDGKVTTFGKIRGLNTAAYTEGQTLWVSSTTAGAFQTTRPVAPNLDLEVAIVINSHANNGTIFVRANNGHYLGTAHDVNISSVTENDLLVYKTNRWVNTKSIGDLSAANVTVSGYLRGPEVFVIDPAAFGNNTGLVQILGDLRVDGVTTTINSTTISVSDKNITLAKDAVTAGDANGAGITIAGANATLTYLSANDDFTFNKNVNASRFVGPLTGDVTGTVSTLSNHDTDDLGEGTTNLYFTTARARDSFSAGTGVAINAGEISIGQSVGTTDNVTFGIVTASLSGNASTASALANARNIALDGSVLGNADFDGSGNITITTTTNHNHDDRYYTETESDGKYLLNTTDTLDGNLTVTGDLIVTGGIDLSNADLDIGSADIIFGTTAGGATRGLIWDVSGSGFLSKLIGGGADGGKVTLFANMDDAITTGNIFEIKDGSTGSLFLGLSHAGILTAGGGTSTQWNTAYNYSTVGHLPLTGGTLTGSLTLSANNSFKATYDSTNSYSAELSWATLQLGNNGVNRIIGGRTAAGGSLYFYVNNTNDCANYSTTPDGIMAMRIREDGFIGIGTQNPGTKFEIADGAFRITETGVSSFTTSYNSGYAQFLLDSAGTDGFYFRTYSGGYANRFVIKSSGKIGIGIDDPQYKLDVAGSARVNAGMVMNPEETVLFSIDGTLSYFGTSNGVYLNGAGTNGFLRLNGAGSENNTNAINIRGANAGGTIELRTAGNTRLFVGNNGNVGINTDDPDGKLDVTGGYTFLYGLRLSGADTGNTVYQPSGQLTMSTGDGSVRLLANGATSHINLETQGTPRVRIDPAGKVGINTTLPTARLSVFADGVSPHASPTGISVSAGTGGANLLARDTAFHNWLPFTDGANYYSANAHTIRNSTHTTNFAIIEDQNTVFNGRISWSNATASIISNQLQSGYNYAGEDADFWINYTGYQGGSSYFRDFRIGNGKQGLIAFFDGSTSRVGIGTSNPSAKLDVDGETRFINSADPLNGSVVSKMLHYSPSPFGFVFRGYSSGAHSIQVQREANNGETFGLSLNPNGGNVGIGTNDPGYKLQVYNSSNGTTAAFGGTVFGIRIDNGGTYSPDETTIFGVDNSFYGSYKPLALSASRLSFKIANSEKICVSTDGKVGIGITNPLLKLSLGIDTGRKFIVYDDGGSDIGGGMGVDLGGFSAETSIFFGNWGGSGRLSIGAWTSSQTYSTKVTVLANGYVGIGITNPTHLLDLGTSGTGNSIRARRIFANGTGTDSGFSLNSTLIYEDSSSRFIITNPGSYPSASFCINTSGNVGINRTDPTYKLDVNGNARVVAGLQISDQETSLYASNGALSYYSPTNGVYLNGAGTSGWLRLNAAGTENDVNAINIYGAGAGGYIQLRTAGNTRLFVANGGNIGINTDGPTQKLHVNGYARVQGVSLYGTGDTISGFIGYEKAWLGSGSSNNIAICAEGSNGISFFTNGTGSNRLFINASGQVGINRTSIDETLHVEGNIKGGYGIFNAEGLSQNLRVGGIYGNLGLYIANTYDMQFSLGWAGSFKFTQANTTKFTISTSGTITATGDVLAYSDARVKENIETIDNALDKVMSMRGVSYNRTDNDDKTKKIGVIAQEIQKVLPEVVSEQEDGMLSVSYGNIVGVLIEAIKEQQKQIDELKALLNVSPK